MKNNQKEKVCCFTGHRSIAQNELPTLKQRLENTIESLINQGVVYYACGGAIGFDMLAGFAVLNLKIKHDNVKVSPTAVVRYCLILEE